MCSREPSLIQALNRSTSLLLKGQPRIPLRAMVCSFSFSFSPTPCSHYVLGTVRYPDNYYRSNNDSVCSHHLSPICYLPIPFIPTHSFQAQVALIRGCNWHSARKFARCLVSLTGRGSATTPKLSRTPRSTPEPAPTELSALLRYPSFSLFYFLLVLRSLIYCWFRWFTIRFTITWEEQEGIWRTPMWQVFILSLPSLLSLANSTEKKEKKK